MEPMSVIVITAGVLFVATLARSTFGFGDALIAMPLLTLLVGIRSATPIIALIGSSVTLLIVWRSHARIDLAAIEHLTLSALLGIPVGIWLFTALPTGLVTAALGVCLVLFGGYALWRPSVAVVSDARWAYPFGFIAGGLGGAYNMSGAPIVVYGTLRQWPPAEFRASIHGFYLPTGLLTLVGHGIGGLWTDTVWQISLVALPPAIVAVLLGERLNSAIPSERFAPIIHAALILLGAALLV
jgi:uncharacterized membrane protein YfcA